jgi:hypothetical protein
MLRKLMVGAVLLGFTAACGDSTGPEDFDPTATQQKASAVMAPFANNEALLSLNAVRLPGFVAQAAQAALLAIPSSPTDPATLERFRALGSTLLRLGFASPLALFPADWLGNTYVYNPDTQTYVLDAQRTGAPADGLRLILYAVDPALHTILLPLDEVGYLDLIDVSTASEDAVQIVAVVNGVTFIDYTASAAVGTSATVSAVGYLSNGTSRVDFDLSVTATQAATSFDCQLESGVNSVGFQATIVATEGGSLTLTVSDGDNDVVLDITVGVTGVNGTITYNGDLVVTISGSPDSPTFTKWDGTAPTQAELNGLRGLGQIVRSVMDWFENLLIPAFLVLAAGT